MRNIGCSLIAMVGMLMLGAAANSQPAISRGEQFISTSYQGCMARARTAFQSLGWVNIGSGGDYVNAFKGESGAYITCNESPAGRTIVNVFVASNGPNSGAERTALQAAINSVAAPPVAATAPAPVAGRSFTWNENGRNLGAMRFAADGSAVIDGSGNYLQHRWRVEGCCSLIVSTLDGTYVTRLAWDSQQGAYVGTRDASSRVQDGVRTVLTAQ